MEQVDDLGRKGECTSSVAHDLARLPAGVTTDLALAVLATFRADAPGRPEFVAQRFDGVHSENFLVNPFGSDMRRGHHSLGDVLQEAHRYGVEIRTPPCDVLEEMFVLHGLVGVIANLAATSGGVRA
jgi:hypothetical protein